MIPNVGPLEIVILLVIVLVVFGPKRLPELGGSLGRSIRGFGKGLKGDDEEPGIEPGEPVEPAEPGGKEGRRGSTSSGAP